MTILQRLSPVIWWRIWRVQKLYGNIVDHQNLALTFSEELDTFQSKIHSDFAERLTKIRERRLGRLFANNNIAEDEAMGKFAWGYVISLVAIAILLMSITDAYRQVTSPTAKAAMLAEQKRKEAETLFLSTRDRNVKVTVVTEPDEGFPNSHLRVMRVKYDDLTERMVFVDYTGVNPNCPDPFRKGKTVQIEVKHFRANNAWQAPVGFDNVPNFILWTTLLDNCK